MSLSLIDLPTEILDQIFYHLLNVENAIITSTGSSKEEADKDLVAIQTVVNNFRLTCKTLSVVGENAIIPDQCELVAQFYNQNTSLCHKLRILNITSQSCYPVSYRFQKDYEEIGARARDSLRELFEYRKVHRIPIVPDTLRDIFLAILVKSPNINILHIDLGSGTSFESQRAWAGWDLTAHLKHLKLVRIVNELVRDSHIEWESLERLAKTPSLEVMVLDNCPLFGKKSSSADTLGPYRWSELHHLDCRSPECIIDDIASRCVNLRSFSCTNARDPLHNLQGCANTLEELKIEQHCMLPYPLRHFKRLRVASFYITAVELKPDCYEPGARQDWVSSFIQSQWLHEMLPGGIHTLVLGSKHEPGTLAFWNASLLYLLQHQQHPYLRSVSISWEASTALQKLCLERDVKLRQNMFVCKHGIRNHCN